MAFLRLKVAFSHVSDGFLGSASAIRRQNRRSNMSKYLLTLSVTAIFFAPSCSTRDGQTANTATVSQPAGAPHAASTQPKDGNYPGRGKVTKINMELGSVELDHEEIVGLMPAMIMEFYVSDKWLLTELTVGDQVDFVVQYKHPSETIVSIKKIQ